MTVQGRTGVPLTIESTLTRGMYARILFLLMVRSWGFRAFVVVSLVAAYLSVNTGNYLFFAIFVPAVIVLYAVQVFAAVRSPKNRTAFLPAAYDFTDSGVTIRKQVSRNTLRWDSLVKWKKVGQYCLIYGSKHGFFTIPKSSIPEGRVEAFEALLARKIKRK